MPACPIQPKINIQGPCANRNCPNNVASLEYNCLPLHCSIFDLKPVNVLTNLFQKPYAMQVSLAIKATRIAFSLKELRKCNSLREGFEKVWFDRIENAGCLKPYDNWIDMVNENDGYLIADRMAQVLNSMDIQEYRLKDLVENYKGLFHKVDPVAFAIPKYMEEDFHFYIREA